MNSLVGICNDHYKKTVEPSRCKDMLFQEKKKKKKKSTATTDTFIADNKLQNKGLQKTFILTYPFNILLFFILNQCGNLKAFYFISI